MVHDNGRWRLVGASMGLGAAYDLLFASAILVWPGTASAWLGLALPVERVHFGLNGIFLLLLAALYALAAFRPRRYRGVVAVAAAGRALGAGYLAWAWRAGSGEAFGWLAAGDLAFAVLHAALLFRASRSAPGPAA